MFFSILKVPMSNENKRVTVDVQMRIEGKSQYFPLLKAIQKGEKSKVIVRFKCCKIRPRKINTILKATISR